MRLNDKDIELSQAQPSDEMTMMCFRAGMTSPLGIGTGFGIRFRDHPIAHFVFYLFRASHRPCRSQRPPRPRRRHSAVFHRRPYCTTL